MKLRFNVSTGRYCSQTNLSIAFKIVAVQEWSTALSFKQTTILTILDLFLEIPHAVQPQSIYMYT